MEPLILHLLLVTIRIFAFFSIFASCRGTLGLSVIGALSLTLGLVLGIRSFEYTASSFYLERLEAQGLLLLVVQQFLYGALLALPIALILELLPMLGRLIDTARGAQFAEQLNPALGERVSTLEELSSMMIPLFLFSSVAFEQVLALLIASFDQRNPAQELFAWSSVSKLLALSVRSLTVALSLAAPVLILSLLLDFVHGLTGRFLARLHLEGEWSTIRLLLGLICYLAILGELPAELSGELRTALDLVGSR